MNELQQRQAQAITFLVITSRPLGARVWQHEGVYAQVAKLFDSGMSAYEVAARALKHGQDPKAVTPGVMVTAPKHEVETNKNRFPPKPDNECPQHRGMGQWAGNCSICHGPQVADEQPGDRDTRPGHSNVSERVAELRRLKAGESA